MGLYCSVGLMLISTGVTGEGVKRDRVLPTAKKLPLSEKRCKIGKRGKLGRKDKYRESFFFFFFFSPFWPPAGLTVGLNATEI